GRAATRPRPDPAGGGRDGAGLQPGHPHPADHPPLPALVLVAAPAPSQSLLVPPASPPSPTGSRSMIRSGSTAAAYGAEMEQPSPLILVDVDGVLNPARSHALGLPGALGLPRWPFSGRPGVSIYAGAPLSPCPARLLWLPDRLRRAS